MNNGTIHRLAAGLVLSAVLASGSASAAVALLKQPPRKEAGARDCVLQRYNWDSNLQRIERLLESGKIEPDL